MATLTKNCTYSSYNAFNPYGYGSAQSGFEWHGWGGSKVNNQYGFAGVRSNGSIRYAFAIRFKTPVFSGTSTNLVIKYHMNRETSAAATVNVTVTRFDPSSDTSSYTNTSLPSDPYSLGSAQQSCVSGDAEYTLTVPSTSILSNTTYYLVISPTPGTTTMPPSAILPSPLSSPTKRRRRVCLLPTAISVYQTPSQSRWTTTACLTS